MSVACPFRPSRPSAISMLQKSRSTHWSVRNGRGALLAGLLAVMAALVLSQPGTAQTANPVFEQGLDAYDRGDFARAAVLFQQSCDDGTTNACSNLAVLYMTGQGVGADPARGIALFDAACRLGSSEGCDNAATARQRASVARPRSRPVATASTLQGSVQACLNGSQADCVRAGRAYTLGDGVAADMVVARPLILRACDGGDMNSCSWVGVSLERGDAGPADLAEAATYYERACDGNLLVGGCGYLGRFYELAGDYEMALPAYARACTDDSLEYCRLQGQAGPDFRSGAAAGTDLRRRHRQRLCPAGLHPGRTGELGGVQRGL